MFLHASFIEPKSLEPKFCRDEASSENGEHQELVPTHRLFRFFRALGIRLYLCPRPLGIGGWEVLQPENCFASCVRMYARCGSLSDI